LLCAAFQHCHTLPAHAFNDFELAFVSGFAWFFCSHFSPKYKITRFFCQAFLQQVDHTALCGCGLRAGNFRQEKYISREPPLKNPKIANLFPSTSNQASRFSNKRKASK